MQREVEQLGGLLDDPARPFVVVIGGAKVADKLGVLRIARQLADSLLVGGAMAFTFLAALGHDIGASLVDPKIEACAELLRRRQHRAAGGLDRGRSRARAADREQPATAPDGAGRRSAREVVGRSIPDGWTGFDIGPATAELLRQVDRRGRHRALERADGRVRGPAL